MIRAIAGLVMVSLLAGCASNKPPRTVRQYIDRVLETAPGEAQPSKIVATESAFARMAREEGQWTAFRAFAASGAVLHGAGGPIAAGPWLEGRSDPEKAVQWAPRSVYMNCDGSMAVSFGRFRDPQGQVGHFVTVWHRQIEDEYRYIYDGGAPDDPQPAPRPDLEPGEDDIVVTAFDSILGLVADCPVRGETVPAPPEIEPASGQQSGGGMSKDGTLRWRWEQIAQGQHRFVADYWQAGSWQTPLDVTLPISGRQ